MAGFTVSGVLDNTLYQVKVTGDASNPVVGSKRVRLLVRQYAGQKVQVTPTGPVFTVNPGDPKSILALLSAKSKVTHAGSDGETVPRLVDEPAEGVIH